MLRHGRVGAIAVGSLSFLLAACGSSGHGNAASSGPSASAPGSGPAPTDVTPNPAGDIPDTQVYVVYRDEGGRFSVKVPEGWSRTQVANGVSFTDKLNTVTITATAAASAPTVSSVSTVEVPALQSAANFHLTSVGTIELPAGMAIVIKYTQDSPPDPVTGKVIPDAVERYEFWRSGTTVTLTLSGPLGADNVDPWRTITDSFTWL